MAERADDVELTLDLEDRLGDDADGRLKAELLGAMDERLQAVRRRLDAGAPPAEFERLEAVRRGLESACTVLEAVWSSRHAGS